MKHFLHKTSGITGKFNFTPLPDNTALIDIVHVGEYQTAIVEGKALEQARKAYDEGDIDTIIGIFGMAA